MKPVQSPLQVRTIDGGVATPSPVSYSALASEYYNTRRHPTCRAFREASHLVFHEWTRWLARPRVCEIGAGRSLVAERPMSSWRYITVTDSSPEMLKHSLPRNGTSLAVADARSLPFDGASFDVVVSILGDPYNTTRMWLEARRILTVGGVMIFTTPAHEWARDFRGGSFVAEFQLRDGRTVAVPSFVHSVEHQRALVQKAGFDVLDVRHVTVMELDQLVYQDRRPVKLLPPHNPSGCVVTGFLLRAK